MSALDDRGRVWDRRQAAGQGVQLPGSVEGPWSPAGAAGEDVGSMLGMLAVSWSTASLRARRG